MPKPTPEVLPADTHFNDTGFHPITVDDTDRTVTIQDLEILNGILEMSLQSFKGMKTVIGLINLNDDVRKTLAMRRMVMKLPFGSPKGAVKQGRVIEPLPD